VTTKSDFTDEDWARVVRAPFIAGLAITLSDPGGPFELTKESMATMKAATNPPSREQLLADVALEVQALAQDKTHPLKGYKPDKQSHPGEQVLEELRQVRAIVEAKATHEEAVAFGLWLASVAQAAAEAAKDGGFMGIGAQQVSEREQSMLDRVRQVVSE
jgi:hypothetical protein